MGEASQAGEGLGFGSLCWDGGEWGGWEASQAGEGLGCVFVGVGGDASQAGEGWGCVFVGVGVNGGGDRCACV